MAVSLINKILLIYLSFILIYILYSFYLFEKENLESIYISLGNHLSVYFHKLGSAILQKSNFTSNEETANFVKYLPTEIIFEDNDLCKSTYDKFVENGVTYENTRFLFTGEWFIKNDNHMKFWICMKPLVHSILDEAFKKTGVNKLIDTPIIHFRCSDIPFIKHSMYHLYKYEFYKRALQDIIDKTGVNYNKVKILYSNSHQSNEEYGNACDKYTSSLKKYLEDLNYDVEVYTNSDIEDFADMFYAPAVIAGCGSYTFMSGFFGDGIFITGKHVEEDDVNQSPCKLCDNWMYDGYQLKHKYVDDYIDTDKVTNMLRNTT